MDLLNQQVTHDSFGQGTVVEYNDSYIRVDFPKGEKRFIYPDALGEFLFLVDKKIAAKAKNFKAKIEAKREEERIVQAKMDAIEEEKRRRRLEREQIMKNHKLSPVSQAAFWVDEEEADVVFSDWQVFTGLRMSGKNEGKPNKLVRLHQNSACIITQREADVNENMRRFTGVFMVDEKFIGKLCEDGNISAHPKYRLRLSEDEAQKLPFWKYYVNERYPHNMTWNSGRSRYFENVWMAQVLRDILAIKSAPEDKAFLEDFLEYFCDMNRLVMEEIPEPNGALVRVKVG